MVNDFAFITSQLSHKPSKGHVREEIVRDFLRKYLPSHLGVGSGIVISSIEGERESKQLDTVIYDRLKCPLFLDIGGIQIFPVEMVYAVIEVKSKLDKKQLLEAVRNIKSVKALTKQAYADDVAPQVDFLAYGEMLQHAPVIGFIFAFDAIDGGKILEYLAEADQGERDLKKRIDVITVLNKYCVANFLNSDCYPTPRPGTKRIELLTKTKSLLTFYIWLWNELSRCDTQPFDMRPYITEPLGRKGRV